MFNTFPSQRRILVSETFYRVPVTHVTDWCYYTPWLKLCHVALTQSLTTTCVRVLTYSSFSPHPLHTPTSATYLPVICKTDGWIYWTFSENTTGSIRSIQIVTSTQCCGLNGSPYLRLSPPPICRRTQTNCLVIATNVSTKNFPFNKMSR